MTNDNYRMGDHDLAGIFWRPIADLPEKFKDGRTLLMWSEGFPHLTFWLPAVEIEGGGYWIGDEGAMLSPSAFAEVNGPDELAWIVQQP